MTNFDSTPSSSEDPFETFLKDSTENVMAQEFYEMQNKVIAEDINNLLTKYDVPAIVNAKGELQPEISREYEDDIVRILDERDEYVSPSVREEIVELYVNQRINDEMTLYAKVSMQKAAIAYGHTSDQPQKIGDFIAKFKKEIMAQWVLKHEGQLDPAWILFLNEAIPGDALSADQLTEAVQEQEVQELFIAEQKEKSHAVRLEAQEKAGLREFFEQSPMEEVALFTIALHASIAREAEVAEQIHDYARSHDLSPESLYIYISVIQATQDK